MAKQAIIELVQMNPNDQIGGGGCLCSETKRPECRGPFVVFKSVEMESSTSPFAVACSACLQDGLLAIQTGDQLKPTSDLFFVGDKVMSSDQRLAGTGARDESYVPLDADDAKLPRDGSPGASEVPDLSPKAEAAPAPAPVLSPLPDAPPASPPATLEPVKIETPPAQDKGVAPAAVVEEATETPAAEAIEDAPAPPPEPTVHGETEEQLQADLEEVKRLKAAQHEDPWSV